MGQISKGIKDGLQPLDYLYPQRSLVFTGEPVTNCGQIIKGPINPWSDLACLYPHMPYSPMQEGWHLHIYFAAQQNAGIQK